ncbi:MAG: family 20 glycosylhydrolase [Bacteroidaceae bacterium]|nr:family 20 glycosylhydrolase [Bacteroidaceae bacterium]
MKNRILFLLAVICFALTANAAAVEKNAKPFVIPELREWKGATGEFTITKETKIVYPKNNTTLAEVAMQFASDYKKMTGIELKVVEGKSSKGDIVFSVKKNKKLGNEGYTINIANKIDIAAGTPRAAMWATRTILQIAEQNNGNTLPKGNIVDYPDYEMRSFMLDCGRKFIPISFLHEYVDFMSYYKMNTFHIHLNDNAFKQYFNHDWSKTPSGFRLESDFFPGLTSRDGYYTKEEFIELQKHAERVGVEIIPEIDVPAHSLAFVHYRPELGSKDYGLDHLDLFNPSTYTFIDSLFMEYLSGDEPVFRGPRFHVGTDEYSNRDTAVVEKFRYFTDFCIRAAEKYGKQACVWGALTHAKGNTPVKVENVLMYEWYNGYANPTDMINLGYDVISIPDGLTYIVPAAGYYYDYLNCNYLYNSWTPAIIGNETFEEKHPKIKGGSFAVWNDHAGNGISCKDIHYRVFPAMQTMAVKMWTGAKPAVPFEEFDKARLALSDAPGLNIAGRFSGEKRTLVEIPALKPATDLVKNTGIREVGYEYSVSFDIDYTKECPGTVLTSSRDAVFYLADPVSGKLGFSRDGYLMTFNYSFFPGEKAHVTISGNQQVTKLFVNGKLVETLDKQTLYHNEGGKDKMYYVRTLVFPLEKTGNFKSKVTNFKVENVCK